MSFNTDFHLIGRDTHNRVKNCGVISNNIASCRYGYQISIVLFRLFVIRRSRSKICDV